MKQAMSVEKFCDAVCRAVVVGAFFALAAATDADARQRSLPPPVDDQYNADDQSADDDYDDEYSRYEDEDDAPRRPRRARRTQPRTAAPRSPYRFQNDSEFFFGPTIWALTFDMKTLFATADMKTVADLIGLTISDVNFTEDFGLDADQVSIMPLIGVRWGKGSMFTLRGISIRLSGNRQVPNGLVFGDILWGECDPTPPATCSNPAFVRTNIDLDSIALMYTHEFGWDPIVFHFGIGVHFLYMRTKLVSDNIVNRPDADSTTLLPETGFTDEQKIPLPLPLISVGTEAALYQGISAFAAADGTWIKIAYVVDGRAGLTFTPGPWPHIRAEVGYRAFHLRADGDFLGWQITGDMRMSGLYFDFFAVI